jgi:hypothetical protein
MATITDHTGWLITKVHDSDDSGRVGYGQRLQEADATTDSFNGVFGRTIYVHTDLTEDSIPFERRVKWRSFSDDGDPAYDGVVDINWLFAPDDWEEEHSDLAYKIDTFVMNDWGATSVLYNAADIRRCRPEYAEYVARHTRISKDSEAGKRFLSNAGVDPQAWIEVYS